MHIRQIGLLVLLAFLPLAISAQRSFFASSGSFKPYTSVSVGGGSAHYIGDLTVPYRDLYRVLYKNVRWNATANYLRYLTPRLGVRVSYSYIRLYGDDYLYNKDAISQISHANSFLRNLHFRNDVQEFTLTGVYNLREDDAKNQSRRLAFMPYVVAGIGLIGHDPKALTPASGPQPSTEWVSLRQYNTSGQGYPGGPKVYSLIQAVVPVAVGVRTKLTRKLDLNFEMGWRLTTTDYLDDVGGSPYPPRSNNYDLTYRAGEEYHAPSGVSRADLFAKAANTIGKTGIFTPRDAQTVYDPQKESRGYGTPFYHKFDQYLTTQLTLSYVLSNTVKCPTIQ